MNRRIFLRGLGGAVVAAPFLASLAERRSRGAATTRPRQLIVMFTHNGCVTTKFFPEKSHGKLAAGDLTATNLAALAPFVGKLLIPRGIRAMNEWTSANNGIGGRGQGTNEPYAQTAGSYFTLQPVTPNGNDPFSFDSSYLFKPRPIGPSLDHVIAQQLSTSGVPFHLRVAGVVSGDTPDSAVSYVKGDGAERTAAANAFPGLSSPMHAFNGLTGLFGTGSVNADTVEILRGKKVCDVVRGDLETLERQDMSAEDRNKLAVWKEMCNDAGTIVSQCSMDMATRLGATPENLSAATKRVAGTDLLTNKVTADLDGADVHAVMAVLAACCNASPVIFLKYPLSFTFTGLGMTVDTVGLSHRIGNAGYTGTCLADALSMLQTIDRYYVSKFAKLVGMLDGIKNADGSTLLDSTATVWFNHFSDGLAGNLNNLPIIQAGSCGGYFKTGWTVNVDPANPGSPALTRGNSEAQCTDGTANGQANGISQVTGTDPNVANGPINKYFYNLMNALGVKADASGYPTKGGSAEVSKFGYSDLTTDFNGGYGAVATATIHSPGEYTALKAGS